MFNIKIFLNKKIFDIKKKLYQNSFFISKKNYFELECGYWKCGWKHHTFQAGCQYCREEFCKNCYKFNITFKILLKQTDEIGKYYLKNFVNDILQADNIKFEKQKNCQFKKKKNTHKIKCKKWKNNRIQVVNKKHENVEKLNYNFKGQKRSFYEKNLISL